MDTFRHGETIDELKTNAKDARKTMFLNEIYLNYRRWKEANLAIESNSEDDLKEKIRLYADYRRHIFQKKYRHKNSFLGDRKLYETALSEFVYYVYKDMPITRSKNVLLTRAFIANQLTGFIHNIDDLKNEKVLNFREQKMRCVIGRSLKMQYRMDGRKAYFTQDLVFPLVITETAMILDDWLFNSIHRSVRRIKKMFPDCLALIVAEVVHDDFSSNIQDSALDGLYIIQQQTMSMKRKNISFDVIDGIVNHISKYFAKDENELKRKIESGIILK
ncbi:MAG: Bpu10I family restriction endonuclease [Candidatus Cloacimonadota bacterium]|nr:Bpu10I family restriction endonuclease [Candidatus Cloacimonadota bacterium]